MWGCATVDGMPVSRKCGTRNRALKDSNHLFMGPAHVTRRFISPSLSESKAPHYSTYPETRQRGANRVVPWGRIGAENELAQFDVRH